MASLTIGLVYETFEAYPRQEGDPPDSHVEYEPESTIEALERAIEALGHQPRRLGSPRKLLDLTGEGASPGLVGIDLVFNLSEGYGGRNREAWAPVILEMAGIPTLGSDALSLSLSLDKAWANRWVAAAGVRVAAQTTFADGDAVRQAESFPAPFPLFVKPRWEGTAKGIQASSRVTHREALAQEVDRIARDYAQPALVEAFIPGAEYTVTLIGNDPVVALPAVQRALEAETRIGLHALEGPGASISGETLEHVIDGVLGGPLEEEMAQMAIRVFECLECRDFARVDFRLDEEGVPIFLEINPLPTFATDGTFAILAELEGVSLSEMLGRCIQAGIDRFGLSPGGVQLDRAPDQDLEHGRRIMKPGQKEEIR